MHVSDRVSAHIAGIYESAGDEVSWGKVVHELLALTHCRLSLVSVVDAKNLHYEALRLYGPEDSRIMDAVREYEEEHYLGDETLKYARQHPAGRFCDSRDVYPKDSYRNNPYMQWSRSRLGSTQWLVGYTMSDDGLTFGVSIHPEAARGPPTDTDLRLFRMLFNHMDHAVRLAARPALIESAKDALVFLGRDGSVLEASPLAREYLDLDDGLSIVDGWISCAKRSDTARLERAALSALGALTTGGVGGAVRVKRPSGRRDWLVTVIPMPVPRLPCLAFQPKALVRIVDPFRPLRNSALHREMFGLTQREVEVADLLLAGHSVHSLAATLGISPHTARVHLQVLFKKTGTSRQSELLRVLSAV